MKAIKKGPGSHNRITKKVIAHHERSQNLEAPCSCIIHRTKKQKPTILSKTEFNRQGDGHQTMCRKGKTLIDAIKHKFWRIANAVPLIAYQEEKFPCTVWNELKLDPFLQSDAQQKVLQKIEEHSALVKLRKTIGEAPKLETVLEAGQAIEEELTVRGLGFYSGLFDDSQVAYKKFSEFNQRLHDLTAVEKLRELHELLDQLIDSSSQSLYVKESSKENRWNEIAIVGKNWSKRNDLYKLNDKSYVKAGYRGPFHNTMSKSSAESGSRLVRFLVEIDRTNGPREVNRWIIKERPAGYHADHIMPLALGGRHTKKNITFIPHSVNIRKKDKLTFDAYKELVADVSGLVGMINKDALPVVFDCIERIGSDENKFNKESVYITALLRQAMSDRRQRIAQLSPSEAIKYIQSIRPDLNRQQAERFFERFLKGMKL